MQIESSKQDLVQALKFVGTTVAKSGDDLSGHYLFRVVPGSDTAVEVLAYDGKVSSSARLNCKYTPTEGGATSFTFEAKRLDMWLNAVPDAALTLEHVGGQTTAYSPRGTQKFESLDPSRFPFWDQTMAESTPTTKVLANRLKAALTFARPFIYADETKHPHLCQVQFRDGFLYATDAATAVAIKMSIFDGTNFAVGSKNLPNLLNFLNQCGDGEIEIREHDRMVSYHLGTLAIFGESRMHAQFPKLSMGLDVPNQHVWSLNRTEVLSWLNYMISAAPKDHEHLIFEPTASQTEIKMGMACAAGGVTYGDVPCASKTSQPDALEVPAKGFKVRYPYLQKMLAAQADDNVLVGINVKANGGFLRFEQVIDSDHYFAILQWSN